MIAIKNIFHWAKIRKSKSPPFTLLSDENSLRVLELTNAYLENNKNIAEKVDDLLWVSREISELLPQTTENVYSGHMFPISESEYELECSMHLCKLGFYKHAIIALRNALELGILSVYWDIDGNSHIKIQNWLSSNQPTPYGKEVYKSLKKNNTIEEFNKKHKILEQIRDLYDEVSNFIHTRGTDFSSYTLNKSNLNSFEEKSLRKWFQFFERVVKIIITLHILRYPVGLQNIDLWSKFGFNLPAGGYLEPQMVERIRRCLDSDVTETLQTISDMDPNATSIAQQINDMPDLTDEQIRAQEEKMEKQQIQLFAAGYRGWLKSQKKMYRFELKRKPLTYLRKRRSWKRLKKWAKENGCYDKLEMGTMSQQNSTK